MTDQLQHHQVTSQMVFWDSERQVIPHLLYEYFASKGIGLYFPDEKQRKTTKPILIRVEGNLVSEISVNYMLAMARVYIIRCTAESGESGPILDSMHRSTSLFSDKNLNLLPILDPVFISDTKEVGYLCFSNGIAKVTSESISLIKYEDFDGHVWESSIINLNFNIAEYEELVNQCDFMKFIGDLTKVEDAEESSSRFNTLSSAIGYLMHSFKDGTTTKAIILMDMFVNGQPNGGSGKTLLMKAVSKVRKLSILDGKNLDLREWFQFSSVSLDTHVMLFDDVKKNFNLEQIFPIMSTGLFLRRKYKDHLFIPHEKAPKVAITTNYAINGDSSSFNRRMWEFEVSPTYSANYSPKDKYGKNFFDEWNDTDWNLFYNTMLYCLQLFLQNGLLEPKPINIRHSKLISSTCEEFLEFANHRIQMETQLDKRALYLNFIQEYPEFRFKLQQRTFTNWLRDWGSYMKYKIVEGHTGNTRYILFVTNTST